MNKKTYPLRPSVVINFFGVLIILVLFYLVKLGVLQTYFLILEIIPLTLIVLSFRRAFVKTDIWKITHASSRKLDEREAQVVYRATNLSYSLFAILTLVVIYLFILSGFGQIDAVLAICILYIAHILPASVIAWNDKFSDDV